MSENLNLNEQEVLEEEILELETLQQQPKEEPKAKMLAMKIICAILFALATAYVGYMFISALSSTDSFGRGIGLALTLALSIYVYAIPFVVSLITMIVAIVKKAKKKITTGTLVYFIVFAVLPIFIILLFRLIVPMLTI